MARELGLDGLVFPAREIGDRVLAEWLVEAAAVAVEVEEARACIVSNLEGLRVERGGKADVEGGRKGEVGSGQRKLTDYWEAVRRAGELFPKQGQRKTAKKRGKRGGAAKESAEVQVARANALFGGSRAAPL